ncbi:MAG: hypothetical protein ACT4P6_13815 [Gemmatimonadaceae bacterium]
MSVQNGRSLMRVVAVFALAAATLAPSGATMQGSAVLDQFDFREQEAVQAKLPRALQEISGLAVASDGRVFAHGDERAVVAQIDACAAKVIKAFALGKPPLRGDFEGIAIAGERFFLITSSGQLYEFREGADGAAAPFTVRDTGFGKVCEVEGLAYEPGDRVLLAGCKRTARPELRAQITVLRWSLDRAAPAIPPSLTISLRDVLQRSGNKGFHTSAIERHARTGNYVLVAGPERALIEVTAKGSLLATRPLRRQLHPQPEGVTFLGDSVLVVGDEGADRGAITCYHRAR